MERLRILFISDIYYPHIGGVSEHIYHLANEFENMGHDVFILTANIEGELRPDEHRVIRVGGSIVVPTNLSHSRIAFKVGSGTVSRIVNRYDVVHIHGTISPTLPFLTLKTCRKTIIFTFHPTFDNSLPLLIFKRYLMNYYKRINGKIAVSKTAMNSISKYFPGDYRIIPNGVDTRKFKPDNNSEIFPNEILFVGRIEPRKGLQYLIDAFPLIRKEIPDARLKIVGAGYREMRLNVPEEIKRDIEFLGFVNPEELPAIFRRACVFVSPAIGGESFGIVLIEAMASGTPVIASDIPGYRCVIKEGYNGLLVKPKDVKSLARPIISVMKKKSLRDSLIEGGLESAENYSWEKISQKVMNFYHEINPSLP